MSVADDAHAFDAVDSAVGLPVGVPDLKAGALDLVYVHLPARGNHQVDAPHYRRSDVLGGVARDVDTDLLQRPRGQVADRVARCAAGGVGA
jgi:hypothetical protein